jgi:hypothetical protein
MHFFCLNGATCKKALKADIEPYTANHILNHLSIAAAMSVETQKIKKSKKNRQEKKDAPKTETNPKDGDQLVKTKKKYVDQGLASLFQSSVSYLLPTSVYERTKSVLGWSSRKTRKEEPRIHIKNIKEARRRSDRG